MLLCYPATEKMLDGVREQIAPLGDYAGATLIDSLLAPALSRARQPAYPARYARRLAILTTTTDPKTATPAPYLADIRESLWN
ncbi:urease accessory protein UreD [Citrobacter koseri]|nr:urease accessory protein UreD [Citrobacter koseri]